MKNLISSNKAGVYIIINNRNQKVYVGSSVNLRKRERNHFSNLRHNRHSNPLLQNAFNKHGESAFSFKVCEIIENEDALCSREQYYLDFYQSYRKDCGYNLRRFAKSNLGIKPSNESIEKRVNSRKGYKHSEETRRRISLGNKGRVASQETRKLWSIQRKGKTPWCQGRKLSEEHRQKISDSHKGKKLSLEHRKRIGGGNVGRKVSEATKRRIGEANKKVYYRERDNLQLMLFFEVSI